MGKVYSWVPWHDSGVGMVLALDNDEIARDLAAIALAAAQPVLHHYALASPARLKSDASPVTAASSTAVKPYTMMPSAGNI